MRNPFLVDADEAVDALYQLEAVEGRQARPHCRVVHPLHIEVGAEHSDLAVRASVGLHPLEELRIKVSLHNLRG